MTVTTNQPPLPAWAHTLRPGQSEAVDQIVDEFDRCDLVILDAPVGSGKTLVAELVRRALGVEKAVYVCSDKGLQDQVERDFPYSRVLKGRANYPTLDGGPGVTADDCVSPPAKQCFYCEDKDWCPYRVAKMTALAAELAVLNTSMFLNSANFAKFFTPNELVIADECDTIEGLLIGFVEFEVPFWALKATGEQVPKKGVHKTTLVRWLDAFCGALMAYRATLDPQGDIKRIRALQTLVGQAERLSRVLTADLGEGDGSEESGHWFRDYETKTFKMRPVTVAPFAESIWWRHGVKWLLMSGTVVSAQEMVDSLGWDRPYAVVSMANRFPVAHRPIRIAPVADLTYKRGELDYPKVARAIQRICAQHSGRVLVHTHNYKLTNWLYSELSPGGLVTPDGLARAVYSHDNARDKAVALARYLEMPDAVLLSPGLARGVDLFDDRCRVQIIAKCPFPSLADKQVSLRLRLRGGDLWYAVRTVREVVQMTGRGVRSETDWCDTFILDVQFMRNTWARNKGLFLDSFKDAVVANQDIRWLLEP